jgi:hypothetical protein
MRATKNPVLVCGFVVGTTGLIIGLCAWLGCVAIVAWQVLNRLQSGKWVPLTVAEGLTYMGWQTPSVEWIGLQRIIDICMAGPLSLGVLLGLGLIAVALFIGGGVLARFSGAEEPEVELVVSASPPLIKCSACSSYASRRALNCPSCGAALRRPRRSLFGKMILGAFWLFNALMALAMSGGISHNTHTIQLLSGAEKIGAKIGASLVTMINIVWVFGIVILGLMALLTRPRL